MRYKSQPISRISLHSVFPVFFAVPLNADETIFTRTEHTIFGPCVVHYRSIYMEPTGGYFGVVKKVEFKNMDLSFVATDEISGSLFQSPASYYAASSDEEVLMNFIMKYFG